METESPKLFLKRIRWPWVIIGLLAVVAVACWSLYAALQHVPDFYRKAMEVDVVSQESASQQMLQQTSALAGAFKREGRWEAVFTTEQINGWLAVDLARNYPKALPPMFQNPRVAINAKHMTLASLVELNHQWSVVNLTVEPYMPEPDVLALRILSAKAGLVPVPLRKILDGISHAATNLQLHVEWRQFGGDPVAILSLPAKQPGHEWQVKLDSFRLGDGEVYVAGTTDKDAAHP